MPLNLLIRTDGGARGNPGPSGIGVVIEDFDSGKVLEEHAEYIGETTNNQAEYKAVILGLTRAVALHPSSVTVVADSELLVKQMTGKYRVKNPGLAQRFLDVRNLEVKLGVPVHYRHTRREQNTHADRLANEAMDRRK
jgi:ribonuclease HI